MNSRLRDDSSTLFACEFELGCNASLGMNQASGGLKASGFVTRKTELGKTPGHGAGIEHLVRDLMKTGDINGGLKKVCVAMRRAAAFHGTEHQPTRLTEESSPGRGFQFTPDFM